MSYLLLVLTIMLCEYVVASHALAFTARGTLSRNLCIFCLFALAAPEISYLFYLPGPELVRGVIAFSCIIKLLHFVGLFLILQVEVHQLMPQASSSYLSRYKAALNCVTSLRGIGTPWETRTWPPDQEPSKYQFIAKHILVLGWQYLTLDLLNFGAVRYFHHNRPDDLAVGAEFIGPRSTKGQLIGRLPLFLILGINLRLLFAMVYGGLSTVCVLVNLGSPKDWPPLFGSLRILQMFTIRGFWGQYWHQLIRWPLRNSSRYIQEHFGLFQTSSRQAQKAIDLFLMFSISGVLHVFSAVYAGVLDSLVGIFMFFVTVPFFIIIEDVCKSRWSGTSHLRSVGALGFLWGLAWLYVCSPWFGYTALRLPVETNPVMPFSFVEVFGIQAVMGAVVSGWLTWVFVGRQPV